MSAEDYMDAVRYIKLSVRPARAAGGFKVSIKKTDRRWYALLVKLLYDYYLFDWKKNYQPEDHIVPDGGSWTLELGLTKGRKRSWRGDNAYPPYWKEVLKLFKSVK